MGPLMFENVSRNECFSVSANSEFAKTLNVQANFLIKSTVEFCIDAILSCLLSESRVLECVHNERTGWQRRQRRASTKAIRTR